MAMKGTTKNDLEIMRALVGTATVIPHRASEQFPERVIFFVSGKFTAYSGHSKFRWKIGEPVKAVVRLFDRDPEHAKLLVFPINYQMGDFDNVPYILKGIHFFERRVGKEKLWVSNEPFTGKRIIVDRDAATKPTSSTQSWTIDCLEKYTAIVARPISLEGESTDQVKLTKEQLEIEREDEMTPRQQTEQSLKKVYNKKTTLVFPVKSVEEIMSDIQTLTEEIENTKPPEEKNTVTLERIREKTKEYFESLPREHQYPWTILGLPNPMQAREDIQTAARKRFVQFHPDQIGYEKDMYSVNAALQAMIFYWCTFNNEPYEDYLDLGKFFGSIGPLVGPGETTAETVKNTEVETEVIQTPTPELLPTMPKPKEEIIPADPKVIAKLNAKLQGRDLPEEPTTNVEQEPEPQAPEPKKRARTFKIALPGEKKCKRRGCKHKVGIRQEYCSALCREKDKTKS